MEPRVWPGSSAPSSTGESRSRPWKTPSSAAPRCSNRSRCRFTVKVVVIGDRAFTTRCTAGTPTSPRCSRYSPTSTRSIALTRDHARRPPVSAPEGGRRGGAPPPRPIRNGRDARAGGAPGPLAPSILEPLLGPRRPSARGDSWCARDGAEAIDRSTCRGGATPHGTAGTVCREDRTHDLIADGVVRVATDGEAVGRSTASRSTTSATTDSENRPGSPLESVSGATA